jgi:hypothetical protein
MSGVLKNEHLPGVRGVQVPLLEGGLSKKE